MIPQKPFDVMVDDVIECDIDQWQEDKNPIGSSVEPEQIDLFEEE